MNILLVVLMCGMGSEQSIILDAVVDGCAVDLDFGKLGNGQYQMVCIEGGGGRRELSIGGW